MEIMLFHLGNSAFAVWHIVALTQCNRVNLAFHCESLNRCCIHRIPQQSHSRQADVLPASHITTREISHVFSNGITQTISLKNTPPPQQRNAARALKTSSEVGDFTLQLRGCTAANFRYTFLSLILSTETS